MPTCFLTVSEESGEIDEQKFLTIRKIVAEELTSRARFLDHGHVVLRVVQGRRADMLGQVEVEVFCQFFVRRFFDRDRRAERISRRVSTILALDCATWINMSVVGYSRVTKTGHSYFSD